jgi:hypothetical protein
MGSYEAKSNAVEEFKKSFKGDKTRSKEEQKAQVKELEKAWDKRRKEGLKQVKAKVAEVSNSDSLSLTQKLEQLKEGGEFEQQVKALMEQLWVMPAP